MRLASVSVLVNVNCTREASDKVDLVSEIRVLDELDAVLVRVFVVYVNSILGERILEFDAMLASVHDKDRESRARFGINMGLSPIENVIGRILLIAPIALSRIRRRREAVAGKEGLKCRHGRHWLAGGFLLPGPWSHEINFASASKCPQETH